MKTLFINKKKVVLYESIKEMPIHRYNAMQSYIMQDVGIGNDMAAIENHFKALDAFLASNKIEDAIKERQNLHIAFYCALEKINFKSMSFACLVESINNKKVYIDEESLKIALESLKDITVGQVDEILDELKKNCIEN